MSSESVWIGLDLGSTSLKATLLDSSARIIATHCLRLRGRPAPTTRDALAHLESRAADRPVAGVAVTGAGGRNIAEWLGAPYINEIIALTSGLECLAPNLRTVIELGGQDSKLLQLEREEQSRLRLRDFSLNSLCAAGTGSFLDQQAARLGVDIESEFSDLAMASTTPASIAGRCSVFAKSDMIHQQQAATPVEDIAAGLCLALARSFTATVGRGMTFEQPIGFLGGVASNQAMCWAFRHVLGLSEDALLVPHHHRFFGAFGAARLLLNEGCNHSIPTARSLQLPQVEAQRTDQPHQPVLIDFVPEVAHDPVGHPDRPEPLDPARGHELYLGIDVGSISTNLAVLDAAGRVVAKTYLRTESRPIRAVMHGLARIKSQLPPSPAIRGVCTTGSGRYLTGELVGADVIHNEITAQATAAIAFDPGVDTIFEIGGQDSKYISIRDGIVSDFEMNQACAAGTGSFIEEQAEQLGIDVPRDFARIALHAPSPVLLGDRCTVFMESDIVAHQQRCSALPDILAGLAYSIVHNYLNRVVGEHPVGERIFFQGGTAFNKAILAAFRSVTGKHVIVPPHHEVTGAVGAAILARRHMSTARRPSTFRGFDLDENQYKLETFICKGCENRCEIRRLRVGDRPPVHYGSRCDRFDKSRHETVSGTSGESIPDLFAERRRLLLGSLEPGADVPANGHKGTVGIPLALTFLEDLPFWRTFFQQLGFNVRLSRPTHRSTIAAGIESVSVETCFPIKVIHGHLKELVQVRPDFIFLPSQVNTPDENTSNGNPEIFNCPLVQTIPYMAQSGIDFDRLGVPVFSPVIHRQWGKSMIWKELARHRHILQSSRSEIRRALELAHQAQANFLATLEQHGEQTLATLHAERPGVVLIGRPYNACDSGVNLDLPRKLRRLGVVPIPLDMLPLSRQSLAPRWHRLYWRYGRRILKAAAVIRDHPALFAIYVTNFSCGPDSFIIEYFRNEMRGDNNVDKPLLTLEMDEHTADAGTTTRCEAFFDTIENVASGPSGSDRPSAGARHGPIDTISFSGNGHARDLAGRCIYIPHMAPQAYALAAGMRMAGFSTRVMSPTDEHSEQIGRALTSGRQCYPCLLTTGDIIRQTRRTDFDPDRAAFFMPTADGPCRFGQYHQLHRDVLDRLGFKNVPMLTSEQERESIQIFSGSGTGVYRRTFMAVVAVDAMEKLQLATRPYELEPGLTDRWFETSIPTVCDAIQQGTKQFWNVIPRIVEQHRRIPTRGRGGRPLIGFIGEVYVRCNPFANQYVVEQLERGGAEVAQPTIGEWLRYLNVCSIEPQCKQRHWFNALKYLLADRVMAREENRIYRAFGLNADPDPVELYDYARPYLDPSFRGEAILTLGKAAELIVRDNVCGIVNAMPFSCMPGTICAALFRSVHRDHPDVPILNWVCAGQEVDNNLVRLEAFLHEARMLHDRRCGNVPRPVSR